MPQQPPFHLQSFALVPSSLPTRSHYSPEGYATALKNVVEGGSFDYVFAGATAQGKDFLPRLASSFDAGLVSDVTNFSLDGGSFSGTKPLFAGKCLTKVTLQGPKPHFATIRPNALGLPESAPGGSAEAMDVDGGSIDISHHDWWC